MAYVKNAEIVKNAYLLNNISLVCATYTGMHVHSSIVYYTRLIVLLAGIEMSPITFSVVLLKLHMCFFMQVNFQLYDVKHLYCF